MITLFRILLSVLILTSLTSCGSDDPEGPLIIEPFESSLHVGTTQQFTATLVAGQEKILTTSDTSPNTVWESTNTRVATIDAAGLVTAVSAGGTDIVAIQSGLRGSTKLQVSSKTIAEIILEPTQSVTPKGLTKQFTATARFADNTTQDITFDASWGSSIISVASINNSGLATGNAVGTTSISAIFTGISSSSSLEIVNTPVDKLVVTPVNNPLHAGGQLQLASYLILIDGSSYNVTDSMHWSSSETSIASVGNSIKKARQSGDPKGLVTAIAPGSAVITAALTLPPPSGAISASANITVTEPLLTSLQVIPAVASVPLGTTSTLQAFAYYTDGSVEDVTRESGWFSNDPKVVYVVTSGATAGDAIALGVGQANINVVFGGQIANSAATVTSAVITAIQVTPANLKLSEGSSYNYNATAIYSDNSSEDITHLATWIASAPNIVDLIPTGPDAGLVTTLAVGNSEITAIFDGISGSTSIEVTPATITALQIVPAKISAAAGSSGQYVATAFYSDNTAEIVTQQATWLSTDQTILDVVTSGKKAGHYNANAIGLVTVSATYKGITSSALATVTAATITSITIAPLQLSLPVGNPGQYRALAVYSDNTALDITQAATWLSSAPNVAQIIASGENAGSLTTLAEGSSIISASLDGVTGSTSLTVSSAVIRDIVITPHGDSVPLGINGPLIATAIYSDNSSIDATRLATWSSSDAGVISVVTTGENGGQAQSLSIGSSTISTQYEGLTASTDFTVTAAVLVSISVDPANTSIAKGVNLQYTATGVYTDGSNSDLSNAVSWQSSVPTVATIASNGQAESILEGNTQIRATSGGITGTAELAVTAATITTLTIVAPEISMPAGTDISLQAVAIYSDDSTQVVTRQSAWVSDMPSVVSVVATGENAGFAQALSAGGPATITASLKDTDGATSLITVTAATLVDIRINPPNETIVSGLNVQYEAIGVYSDGDKQNITNEAVWSTDNPALVSIDQNGYASTSEILTGTADIIASLEGLTRSTPLIVIAISPDRLEISPKNSEIANLTTKQYSATVILNNGVSFDVTNLTTWASSNRAVATISNQGGTHGLVHAHATDTTIITAQIVYDGITYTDTGDLLVTPAVLDHIVVSSEETTILTGTFTDFFAQAIYVGGATDDITDTATWISSDSAIAIVSNLTTSKGLTIGTGAGNATITARFNNIEDSQNLDVVTANLTTLEIEPLNAKIALGGNVQYTATATLDTGDQIDATEQVIWNSIDTGVAVISSQGNATSVSASSTTISATMDGFNASTNLAVTDSTNNIVITITPLSQRIAKDSELQFEAQVLIDGVPIEDATAEVDWSTIDCFDQGGVQLPDNDCDEVVEISNKKKEKGLAFAEDEGLVTIVGTYTHESSGTQYTASTSLEVLDLDTFPLVLDITPKGSSIEEKKHLQYTLTGTWDTGGAIFIEQDLTKSKDTSWDTQDDDIATIKNDGSKKGEAKGEDPGTTSVVAEFNGTVAAPTFITVTAKP
jgi:hypothetical protein